MSEGERGVVLFRALLLVNLTHKIFPIYSVLKLLFVPRVKPSIKQTDCTLPLFRMSPGSQIFFVAFVLSLSSMVIFGFSFCWFVRVPEPTGVDANHENDCCTFATVCCSSVA